jgi:tetratricopeptide (TPR) repeat protein
MFQHKYFKLSLAILITGLSVWQFIEGNIGNGIFLLLIAILIFFLYIRHEYILMAYFKMRKQDMEGAEKWLLKIKNPEKALIKPQQASYYMMLGLIYSQKNIHQAEKFLRKALKIGLILKQEEALAKLSLAGIMAAKRRKREALNLLNEAKKADKKGVLKENIQMIKQQLKRI